MQIPVKIYLPFRLKLLLAFLAAAGAGIYLSYSGLRNAAGPFSEQQAGARLTDRLDIAAAVINAEVNTRLERARLLAALPVMRETLASGPAAGFPRLPAAGESAAAEISGMDLADAGGKITASRQKDGQGTVLPRRADLRLGAKGGYISAPRLSGKDIGYDITVPVFAEAGKTARPLGALRCRFKAATGQLAALDSLRQQGTVLVLAKRGGQKFTLSEGAALARELNIKTPEAAPFLPALEGKEGAVLSDEAGGGRAIYASRVITGPDWVLAVKAPFSPDAQPMAGLLGHVRLNALLAFTFLATAAFFVVGSLTGPLRGVAREAAALLEECGRPAGPSERLSEPDVLAAGISEAAAALKRQASRDLELETETEKLREEEADLKTQNDELEKLNKYLMEREIKISELKKEISELREKVGSSAE